MDETILRNAWYAAAWSSEVGEKPFSRTLLGQSVLLMRVRDGSVVALGNRCPHRFAPLDRGRIVDDTIQCGYHGLRFDRTGACVHRPDGKTPPQSARVPTYAVCERHQLIWMWGGDPAQADTSLLPDLSALDSHDGTAALIDNYLHTDAGYLLALDNLMDLSHVEFLHAGSLGSGGMSEGSLAVREVPRGVEAKRWMPGIQAPPLLAKALGFSGTVDHWLDMTWLAASNLVLRIGLTAPGTPREAGREGVSYHLITPETTGSSHYFFGSSSGSADDPHEVREARRRAVMRVFIEEDKPMFEACARMMEGQEFWSLKPVLLPSDAGAVRMRRVLKRLLDEEQEPVQPAA